MIDPKEIHIILITFDKQWNFYINMDIIRNNYSFGKDVWLTHVYNGDIKDVYTGIGENNFIKLDNNRGYHRGALDLYNAGLDFAKIINKEYTLIMNSDVWILNQNSFINLFDNIGEKYFSTGKDIVFGRPLTDLFIFKTERIPEIIEEKVLEFRKEKEILKKEYSNTGWDIFEEWMLYSLYNNYSAEVFEGSIDNYWNVMHRGEHPRYSWNEENHILHTHDLHIKKEKLISNNIKKGNYLNKFINGV